MKKNIIGFVFLAFSLIMLAACGPAGEDAAQPPLPDNFIRISDPNSGLALSYPQGWIFREGITGYEIASNQTLLDTGTITQENQGALVNIATGRLDETHNVPPAAIIEELMAASGAAGNVESIEPATEMTINGQPAAITTMRSVFEGLELTLQLVVVLHEDLIVTITTAYPSEQESQYAMNLDAIINSIQFTAPASSQESDQDS